MRRGVLAFCALSCVWGLGCSGSGGGSGPGANASGSSGATGSSGASGKSAGQATTGSQSAAGATGATGLQAGGAAGSHTGASGTATGSSGIATTGASGTATTGSSGTATTGASGTATTGCQANCTGKTCGDDGCGGTCGACPPSQTCSAANVCAAPSSSSTIVVDAKSQLTAISPDIYGVAANSDDSTNVATLNRWGGDASGSYNWKKDYFNSGSDWNCANYQAPFTSPTPNSAYTNSADQFVSYNNSKNLDTLITIPITGWVANSLTSAGANSSCAGSTQDMSCCAKIGTSESVLVDKGSLDLDTSYMGDWVNHLVSTFGGAGKGGVKYYQLDNEPDNWQGLRQDIYPALYPPGTFCESFYDPIAAVGATINQDFINRTMAYAAAVKTADSAAQLLFMSVESPLDLVSLNNLECGNTGSPYTVDNSLTTAVLALGAAHEATTHQRILDCVDMHYPVGSGLMATQALWDKTSSSVFPHVQDWINATYPGTGICVSEYNWSNDGTNGSSPDTTTGVLEADILGMYGRFGVRLASYWTTLVSKSTHLPVYNAMAMYRDYDGKGGHFGSTSIGAASSEAGVDAYAAVDSATSPTTLWVMLVNVSGAAQSSLSLSVANFVPSGSAKVYQMLGGAAPIAGSDAAVSGGAVGGISLAQDEVRLLVFSK